jgi:hypothetical protein
MAKLMKGDKGYFDKAMSLLAVFELGDADV